MREDMAVVEVTEEDAVREAVVDMAVVEVMEEDAVREVMAVVEVTGGCCERGHGSG